MKTQIQLEQELLTVEIIHSSRRTIGLEITPAGEVRLRLPASCPDQTGLAFLREKQGWLLPRLEQARKRNRPNPAGGAAAENPPTVLSQQQRQLAKQILMQKADKYAARLGVTYGRLTVKDQKTRWGSCSAKGNLNFNWRILLAPEEVADYVVVHELAHRLHMDHSAAFYKTVASVMPDYRKQEQWLRENGADLMKR